MGKCAGKNNMFYLVLRTAVVNCICLYFWRIGVFKLDESLGAKIIGWAVVKIQRAPVKSSFASVKEYRKTVKNPSNVKY